MTKQTKRVTVASLMRKTVEIDENGIPDWSTLQESRTNEVKK